MRVSPKGNPHNCLHRQWKFAGSHGHTATVCIFAPVAPVRLYKGAPGACAT